jgi:hypothetical protein
MRSISPISSEEEDTCHMRRRIHVGRPAAPPTIYIHMTCILLW